MRIIFIGAVQFSEIALQKLIEIKSSIVGVCTLESSNFNSDHIDLTKLCKQNNLLVRYTPRINSEEVIDWINSLKPDVIFCFGWSRLIKKKLLQIPPLGVIGFHPTLLPVNRGRHPIIWSLILGLEETGSSFFFMSEGIDSGDILSQKKVPISHNDNAKTLYEKVSIIALEQIEEFVPRLSDKSFKRQPQDHSKATFWRKRNKLDGQIDWRMSAKSIYNLVRGLTKPYAGAHFICDGIEIKVWESVTVKVNKINVEPGKILSVNNTGVIVKTGVDAIKLIQIEPHLNLSKGLHL